MCIIFVLCERFVVCVCVLVHIALLLGNWPHFISWFPFGVYWSWSIMNVCFYIAQYLFMHLRTRFNRKRFRCWNGCYLCCPTHFCASSIWTRIYGLVWFCVLPFCMLLWFMFYICVCAKLAVYPKLLLSLTLYSVLENIMHPCAIRGIEDMNTWKYEMSVIYHTTRNHSKPAFGLFCTGNPLWQLLGTLWMAVIYKAYSLAPLG